MSQPDDDDPWSNLRPLFSNFVSLASANMIINDLHTVNVLTRYDMAELDHMPDSPLKRRTLLMKLYAKDPDLYPEFVRILNKHYHHYAKELDPSIDPPPAQQQPEQGASGDGFGWCAGILVDERIIVKVAGCFASKWQEVGYNLGLKQADIETLETDYLKAQKCCQQMLLLVRQKNGELPLTRVVESLHELELLNYAANLRKSFTLS